MATLEKTIITVSATVNAPVDRVWECWTKPEHITKWSNASDDWHTPSATNDLKVGGRFTSRMEAKDGSFGFDFGGVYTTVINNERIEYTLGDERKVKILFESTAEGIKITESFDTENQNPVEMQKNGWQAILN